MTQPKVTAENLNESMQVVDWILFWRKLGWEVYIEATWHRVRREAAQGHLETMAQLVANGGAFS